MRRLLAAVLTVGGVAAVLIGLTHIVFGPSSIPGSVPVNATMDSEDRFYATLFVGYGVAMLWCVRDIEQRAIFIRFLAGLLFASGISRIVSMVAVGPPNILFQVLTGVEFVVPVLVWWLLHIGK